MLWHFSLCVVVPSEWLVSLNWFELVPKDKRKREIREAADSFEFFFGRIRISGHMGRYI
jgi:hypothetical protein